MAQVTKGKHPLISSGPERRLDDRFWPEADVA